MEWATSKRVKEWIKRMRGTEGREMRMSFMEQYAGGDMQGVGHGVSRPFTLIMGCGRCRLTKIGRKCVVERKPVFFLYMKTEKIEKKSRKIEKVWKGDVKI